MKFLSILVLAFTLTQIHGIPVELGYGVAIIDITQSHNDGTDYSCEAFMVVATELAEHFRILVRAPAGGFIPTVGVVEKTGLYEIAP